MKLTIGMASYNNPTEVWFTIQSLRMNQNLSDTEILVIDNFGSKDIETLVNYWCNDNVRYVKYTDKQGTAVAKNQVFKEAKGEWVLCIDSHILLKPDAIKQVKKFITKNKASRNLYQGPLMYDDLKSGADSFSTVWSDGMWGQWANINTDRSVEPYEIPMMGMGLFLCRKDAWLGFNSRMRGFGGEEGYIHEKYRKHGYKTICLPWLQWLHHFRPAVIPAPYSPQYEDKVRNYTLGFQELGLDVQPLYEHFGKEVVDRYLSEMNPEIVFDRVYNDSIDIKEHLLTLSKYAVGKTVVELGVRNGNSTTAFIYGKPLTLRSYDINSCGRIDELNCMAEISNVDFKFVIGDSRKINIEETDILFIDTLHTSDQLSTELNRHHRSVREYIILHDTETFGTVGEDGKEGLNAALESFTNSNPEWFIEHAYRNNNGLTILKRFV